MPKGLNKINKFYELILMDSKSVVLKHSKDQNNKLNITHLTFQIEKVLSFSKWGKDSSKFKKFPIVIYPIWYNY